MSTDIKSEETKTDTPRAFSPFINSPFLGSGPGTNGQKLRYNKSTIVLDALFLAAVLILVFLFYYPKAAPLKSRYVYYADSFERAGHIYNPDYAAEFKRYAWETYSPFQTLLARWSSRLFPDKPGRALLLMHMCVVLIAAAATYILNRQMLSIAASFLTTALLFCGRVLLPLTRGLGMTQVHLLIPLSLLFILALPRIMNPSGGIVCKAAWTIAGAICLAVAYLLGNHETFYAAFCLGLGICIMVGWWTIRSVLSAGISTALLGSLFSTLSRLRFLFVTFALAIVLGITGMVVVQRGIPERLGRTPLWDLITYKHLAGGSVVDAKEESSKGLRFKRRVLKGTFVEGRYLTSLGKHHQNCFLHPGSGFNGIIPLFLLPGLAIGLACYVRKAYGVVRHKRGLPLDGNDLFLLFLGVLLVQFFVMIVSGADSKPTRYTYAIYALYVIGAWGYEHLVAVLRVCWEKFSDRRKEGRSGKALAVTAACLVFVPLAVLLAQRLNKNYRDLRTYVHQYSHQIPTISLGPSLDHALALSSDSHVAIFLPEGRRYGEHPAVGMYLRFRLPSNIRFAFSQEELDALPGGTDILRPKTMLDPELYTVPRRLWPDSL